MAISSVSSSVPVSPVATSAPKPSDNNAGNTSVGNYQPPPPPPLPPGQGVRVDQLA